MWFLFPPKFLYVTLVNKRITAQKACDPTAHCLWELAFPSKTPLNPIIFLMANTSLIMNLHKPHYHTTLKY